MYECVIMGKSTDLHLLMNRYVCDVSKHILFTSKRTVGAIKTLSYNQFVAVLQQFVPTIYCVSVDECKFIKLSCSDLNKIEYIHCSNYKGFPLTIKQHNDETELAGIYPKQLFDALVCVPKGKCLFVPIIAEHQVRRLHQMTLVFDTNNNVVFLHDPNGRSLFNTDNCHILLQTYIEMLNAFIDEHNVAKVTYIIHEFNNINVPLRRLWMNRVTGNCVVASILFMILYDDVEDITVVSYILNKSKRKDYDAIYTALYNKIKNHLEFFI
jgi:hypothetical protein